MRPLGYLYKHVAFRPHWLKASHVEDVYSLSGCISKNFADYIPYWRHNGFWLFNSPPDLMNLAADQSISLEGTKLFYYEAYELEYDEEKQKWLSFGPDSSFYTNVAIPSKKALEGFDVSSFYAHASPECSPLSCNSYAETIPTNKHCLFHTFGEAKRALESDDFRDGEPGPFRIIAIYSVDESPPRG